MTARDDLWITIPNWEKFQHYRDRNPAWIKDHTEQDGRGDYRALSWAQRGLLQSIRRAFARSNGLLRVKDVPGLCGQRVPRDLLESLNRAGWIQLNASAPLALARSREERRGEKKEPVANATKTPAPQRTPKPPADTRRHRDPDRTAAVIRGWIQGPAFDLDADDDDAVLEEIGRAERRFDATLSETLRAELLELARERRTAAP